MLMFKNLLSVSENISHKFVFRVFLKSSGLFLGRIEYDIVFMLVFLKSFNAVLMMKHSPMGLPLLCVRLYGFCM